MIQREEPADDSACGDDEARGALLRHYAAVRATSEALAAPLSPEDRCVQSMPDASPTKWHLAHTSWFFETLVLQPLLRGWRAFDERYAFLFNSYYESLGPRHPRPQRGVLTRPSCDEVAAYRRFVDEGMVRLVREADAATWTRAEPLLTLGLHHEQQHQELLLTDIKHLLSLNPLAPAYLPAPRQAPPHEAQPLSWWDCAGGRVEIGHDPRDGFAFDNETPRHAVLLAPYQLASRPVTNGEYLEFIRDGGYRRPQLWLSDGWSAVQQGAWEAPLYWSDVDADVPSVFTLLGRLPLNPAEPVCHLSFYEASAYAAWAGARLPTEFEWEAAASQAAPLPAPRFEASHPHPRPAAGTAAPQLQQMLGEVWEWTRSSYDPYPGFRPLPGAVGEYNGKFMVGQLVLRGGSCATPAGHLRASYRNFFPPGARWQFSGLRLARDL